MKTLFLTPADDFVYTASVTNEDGGPYDLTGSTLWFTVKRRKSDADSAAIAKLYWVSGGSAAGIGVADPSSGEAVVTIAATGTGNFAQSAHVWDLQLKDANGIVRTVDRGVIVVRPAVTTRTTTP